MKAGPPKLDGSMRKPKKSKATASAARGGSLMRKTAAPKATLLTAVDSKPEAALILQRDESKTWHQQYADACLSPVTLGATSSKAWAGSSRTDIGINEAFAVVQSRSEAVATGDLDAAKSMLMAQAMTLDVIFNEMARRAATLVKTKEDGTWSFTADTMDALTRMAFKAQSQCRTTLQTLGDLVNPRSVVFAKQANMTNGPQQVNNGAADPCAEDNARGKKTRFQQNKLLEDARDGSTYLDTRATPAPAAGDTAMETLEQVHRPAKPGRQGRSG